MEDRTVPQPTESSSSSGKARRFTRRSVARRSLRISVAAVAAAAMLSGVAMTTQGHSVSADAAPAPQAVLGPASVLAYPGAALQVWLPEVRTAPAPTTTTAPAPTTTTAPAPTTTAPTATRSPALWPFSSNSPWNTPIGSGARFDGPAGTMSSQLHAGGITTWMNATSYSQPVYQAANTDPVVTATQPYGPPATFHVPANATPADGSDHSMSIIQPDGHTNIEMWNVTSTTGTNWTAGRIEVVDLTGNGLGPDNGTRAYGGSAIAGLIRTWEVDPTNPHYDGTIHHPLAIALPNSMLRYTGGPSGYDTNGYGTAHGYVWPATEQDYDSPTTYTGTIPMGSLLAIPKTVNIDALGLSPQAHMIAKALQDYGAYVVDRTGANTISFYAEPTVPTSWYQAVLGPNWTATDLTTIRQQLQVVTNNTPTSVGGGGTTTITTPALAN